MVEAVDSFEVDGGDYLRKFTIERRFLKPSTWGIKSHFEETDDDDREVMVELTRMPFDAETRQLDERQRNKALFAWYVRPSLHFDLGGGISKLRGPFVHAVHSVQWMDASCSVKLCGVAAKC